jgi:hypothetical protein
MFDMRDIRFEHTISGGPLAPKRLIDLSTNGQTFPNHIREYPAYHRYKGLSSIPNLARYTEDILDTKHSIYKHYVPDMGIWRYKGLADMKV